MNYIENYKKFKASKEQTTRWADMLGKQFYGGGGGLGRIVGVELNKVQIYYQFNNGDPNYHNVPQHFTKYLQQAIINQFSNLLEEAKQLEDEDFKKLARLAHGEAQQIAEDAGLV